VHVLDMSNDMSPNVDIEVTATTGSEEEMHSSLLEDRTLARG
jgi:hypothetical protein